jgi:DNA-binding transcriptional LysR family regulator
MRTRVVTCASPDYLVRHGTPRRPSDVEKHRCILMRNPATGSHYEWEFVRGNRASPVNASGQLIVNGAGPLLAACLAGQGVAQMLELYVRGRIAEGRLVQVLPEWADETYPLLAYHHSAQLMSAKVRAFLDFVATLTTRADGVHQRSDRGSVSPRAPRRGKARP